MGKFCFMKKLKYVKDKLRLKIGNLVVFVDVGVQKNNTLEEIKKVDKTKSARVCSKDLLHRRAFLKNEFDSHIKRRI